MFVTHHRLIFFGQWKWNTSKVKWLKRTQIQASLLIRFKREEISVRLPSKLLNAHPQLFYKYHCRMVPTSPRTGMGLKIEVWIELLSPFAWCAHQISTKKIMANLRKPFLLSLSHLHLLLTLKAHTPLPYSTVTTLTFIAFVSST